MTIQQCHLQTDTLSVDENAARYFGRAGFVAAGEIRAAIAGKPGDHHVNLFGPIEEPWISVCAREDLPKFSSGLRWPGGL